MTPREVDQLTGDEYETLTRYALADEGRQKREARRQAARGAGRRRGR